MGKTITLSDDLYRKLEQEAKAKGKPIEALVEGLRKDFLSSPHAPTLAALISGGLPPADLSIFADLVQPGADYEVVRRDLASKTFRTSLSEIIIATRG